MAHKKGLGSSKNGRDSVSKRRGVKKFAGETVQNGNIIVRQAGTKFGAGQNVRVGRDFTLYAVADGVVSFRIHCGKKIVEVVDAPAAVAVAAAK